ncbi:hypothetical protein ACSBR2_012585 [Camellia fascicularis]
MSNSICSLLEISICEFMVLNLLGGEQTCSGMGHPEKPIKSRSSTVQMPDLIDTSVPDDSNTAADFIKTHSGKHILEQKAATVAIFDDLFGDNLGTGVSASEHRNLTPLEN